MSVALSLFLLCLMDCAACCTYKLIIIDGNEVNITTGTENITEITVEKNNNTAPDLADNGLLLNQAANYFRFQYYEPTRQWILQKSVCLNVGYNELLTFALNGSFGDNCLSESLTINALPTKPEIKLYSNDFTVFTCPSASTILLSLYIDNRGQCTIFNCSFVSTNSKKKFWTHENGGAIETYADDIQFKFDYQLNATCAELGVALNDEQYMPYTTNINYEITFWRKSACPAPITTSSLEATKVSTVSNRLTATSSLIQSLTRASTVSGSSKNTGMTQASGTPITDTITKTTGLVSIVDLTTAPSQSFDLTKTTSPSQSPYLTKTTAPPQSSYLTKTTAPSQSSYLTKTTAPSHSSYLTKTKVPSQTSYLTKTTAGSQSSYLTKTTAPPQSSYLTKTKAPSQSSYLTRTTARSQSSYLTKTTAPPQSSYLTQTFMTYRLRTEPKQSINQNDATSVHVQVHNYSTSAVVTDGLVPDSTVYNNNTAPVSNVTAGTPAAQINDEKQDDLGPLRVAAISTGALIGAGATAVGMYGLGRKFCSRKPTVI